MTIGTQSGPGNGGREGGPRILVYSSLFPSAAAPTAGTFIRERMFRVARRLPLVVVAPQPWSPFDWMVRLVRKGFRPMGAAREVVDGIEILRPRFLSLPGVLKRLDSRLMAWSTLGCVRELQRRFGVDIIDAHFAYPDGHAATIIGRRLGLPVTITLRGSKDQRLIGTDCEPSLRDALAHADRVIAVSDSLRHEVAEPLGLSADRVRVIGNGVDLEKFEPVNRGEARRKLGLDADAKVLVGVGNLIELKGFHRVVPLLPALRERFGKVIYLIVGGGTGQGDMSERILALAREHGVEDCVRLCGRKPPEELKWYYGAADVFALATAYEGWANVLLESMACGLPVVTTRVGGNAQVVATEALGRLVEFWNAPAFERALADALARNWNRGVILDYARANAWDRRIDALVKEFEALAASRAARPASSPLLESK